MQVLDRYILKLWLAPFIGFFLVVNIVLLFGRLLSAIQAFGDNPIDGMILAEMLLAILPYFLTLTLPFAFFFALLKVLAYLQDNSESDALLAAGISPLGVLRPMFVMTLIAWILLTWTTTTWMPAGQRTFNELYYAVQKTKALPSFTPGQFTQGLDGLTIYHAGEDDQGRLHKFMLEDKRESPASIYMAKQARLERGGDFILLTMNDGVHLEGEDTSVRATYFDTFSISIETEGLGVVKNLSGKSNIPSFLTQEQLTELLNKSGSERYLAEWHRRWLLPTTIFILFLFALPLSQNGKRVGKSRAWMWGVVLMLAVYNVQIVLHKKVAMGLYEVWLMWAGQLAFIIVGFLLSYMVVKTGHFQWNKIFGRFLP